MNTLSTYSSNLTVCQLQYTKDELDFYTRSRSQDINQKSVYWIVKAGEYLWEQTRGEISQKTITSLYTHTLEKFTSLDSWGKILNFTKSFLKYLSKLHFDARYQNFALFLEMPKTRKDRKTVTSRIVTKVDITHLIDGLIAAYQAHLLSDESMVNYVGITLCGAFTGQRIEATMKKITVGQMRTALKSDPPVLHVLPSQDKIRMEHYVPIHPDIIPIMTQLVEGKEDNIPVFELTSYQTWLKRHGIPLSRAPEKMFFPSDLRKFAEQHGDVIEWSQSNRAYILTHGVSGVDWSHYKHPLPEFVHQVYMRYWGAVHLLEKEMPREITRIHKIRGEHTNAGLSVA